jgi:hypothetical protein
MRLSRSAKDSLIAKDPIFYKIPCESRVTYIDEAGRSIEDRTKKHQRDIRLYHPKRSAVAEH